jgi:hypothetical protein
MYCNLRFDENIQLLRISFGIVFRGRGIKNEYKNLNLTIKLCSRQVLPLLFKMSRVLIKFSFLVKLIIKTLSFTQSKKSVCLSVEIVPAAR